MQVAKDELSTQPGMEVAVRPGGRIKIIKTKDPAWDDEKDEPFIEDSEDESEDKGKDWVALGVGLRPNNALRLFFKDSCCN